MKTITIDDLLACSSLPSLPTIAVKVLELSRRETTSIEEIAAVVHNDPALTAKVLKTVNSSFYGLAKPCPTISRALSYLGLSTLKSLVLGFSLVKVSQSGKSGYLILMASSRKV